jgi:hypothetical protein
MKRSKGMLMKRFPTISLALLSFATPALAWSLSAPFSATAHRHEFHKVIADTDGCSLHYRLYFSAPAEAYPTPSHAHYAFKARIQFQGGHTVLSPRFSNDTPGARMYEGRLDTGPEGCWAKEPQKLLRVEVQACRGVACTPEPFE